MDVYLEIGAKRVFAGVIDWPGWCRGGRSKEAALRALLDYGPRYRRVVGDLVPPGDLEAFEIVERLEGDATTDFGAPGAITAADLLPLQDVELEQLLGVLAGCWSALGSAVERARGRELATGPRGGGRALGAIVEHVRDADESYARKVGGQANFDRAVRARWRGEVPDIGPRGGARWPPRYAIRRAAWHVLDHAWEIEDRAGLGQASR